MLTALVLPTLVGGFWNDAMGAFIYAGLITLVTST